MSAFRALLLPGGGLEEGFLILLLQAGFFGNWLVLAALLLRRVKAHRAALFCMLAAALRLLLPVPVQSPFSLHRLWMGEQAQVVTFIQYPDGQQAQLSPPAVQGAALPALLLPLWAAGAIAVLAFFIRRFLQQRRLLRLCIPVPEGSPIAQAVRRLAGKRAIPAFTCETVSAPLAVGVLRPRIILPSGAALSDELLFALAHECVHIRRQHNLFKLLALLCCCLHWFNPLCWRLQQALCEELEICCDRHALCRFGEQARASYARALLHFYARGAACAFSSGFGGGAAEERIRQIMAFRPRRRAALFAGLLALALFLSLACMPAPVLVGIAVSAQVSAQAQEGTDNLPSTEETAAEDMAAYDVFIIQKEEAGPQEGGLPRRQFFTITAGAQESGEAVYTIQEGPGVL